MAKDFQAMKPREVEAYLREHVRRAFGDATENASVITSSHGYYHVIVNYADRSGRADFGKFRKTEVPKITKAIRALK